MMRVIPVDDYTVMFFGEGREWECHGVVLDGAILTEDCDHIIEAAAEILWQQVDNPDQIWD